MERSTLDLNKPVTGSVNELLAAVDFLVQFYRKHSRLEVDRELLLSALLKTYPFRFRLTVQHPSISISVEPEPNAAATTVGFWLNRAQDEYEWDMAADGG
jgi:hypothetical protein